MTNDEIRMTKETLNPNCRRQRRVGERARLGRSFGRPRRKAFFARGLTCDSRGRKSQRPRLARSPRLVPGLRWEFVLRHSFDIRHSDFIITQSLPAHRAMKVGPMEALRYE